MEAHRQKAKDPSTPRKRGPKGSTIEKTFTLLDAIVESEAPVSVSEMGARFGLPKATVHRICVFLERRGFAQRELDGKRFTIGPHLIDLAHRTARASFKLASRHAILQALAERIGETCNIGILDRDRIVYVDRVEANWPLTIQFRTGSAVPLHCTAIGKLFLAHLPAEQVDKMLGAASLQRFTETTLTTPPAIQRELERIRSQGYSIDNEEYLGGVICIAVPILDPQGRICAALAMQAPRARMSLAEMQKHLPALRKSALQVGQALYESAAAQPPERPRVSRRA
jgi:IclR family transcriptional regulator, acetate operon repressor